MKGVIFDFYETKSSWHCRCTGNGETGDLSEPFLKEVNRNCTALSGAGTVPFCKICRGIRKPPFFGGIIRTENWNRWRHSTSNRIALGTKRNGTGTTLIHWWMHYAINVQQSAGEWHKNEPGNPKELSKNLLELDSPTTIGHASSVVNGHDPKGPKPTSTETREKSQKCFTLGWGGSRCYLSFNSEPGAQKPQTPKVLEEIHTLLSEVKHQFLAKLQTCLHLWRSFQRIFCKSLSELLVAFSRIFGVWGFLDPCSWSGVS